MKKKRARGQDMADEDLVHVFTTSSAVEGELARGRLESEGIPALIKGEGIDAPYPTGAVSVFVPASLEARARALLHDGNSPVQGKDRDP